MKIYPAIDLYGGKTVRLFKGDYNQMTVYSDNPTLIAQDFEKQGAKFIHLVDLEGAKTGETPNLETIKNIVSNTNAFVELGGGIRSKQVIEKYLSVGVNRVILGTIAVTDREFLVEMVKTYGEKIAVGVDIKDGLVAIKGWTEKSTLTAYDFLTDLEKLGVKTVIVTDISKDGAMQGANYELYKDLNSKFNIDIIASGGVSDLEGIKTLSQMNLYGAIVGKAYYTGAVKISDAIKVANDN
ncbi:MAG: 1-(5-phosphoribosyl)-5-[(5-phosphoribosylamino)methylideneamino]imidazole-4-carboxamide isomerase [Clostridia bacterium]|nr:1-(5-phosphoribosyl)-5-[(5-phosphoribosylamino)methylideneamino]imidazole-4-carboxamide isomerase [Clostridia bacterium]